MVLATLFLLLSSWFSWFPWPPSFCCTEAKDSIDFRIQRIYSSNSLVDLGEVTLIQSHIDKAVDGSNTQP